MAALFGVAETTCLTVLLLETYAIAAGSRPEATNEPRKAGQILLKMRL